MDSSRPFAPAFLKKFDRSLLLKDPAGWSARTHLVIYFGALFAGLLLLLCLLMFRDVRQESGLAVITGFTVVIAVIGFVFWLIFLLRFNVFKRYGNWQQWDGLKTFMLFFINILVIVAIPFLPSAAETFMANRQFSDAELINDANEMNLNVATLEYDRLPHAWTADTFKIVEQKFAVDQNSRDTVWENNDMVSEPYHPHVSFIYKRDLEARLISADSSVKVNDSLYYFYESPDYRFAYAYNAGNRAGLTLLSNRDIFFAVIKNHRKPERQLRENMQRFKNKYRGTEEDYYSSNYYSGSDDKEYNAVRKKIQEKYSLDAINNTMSRIAQKKYRWESDYNFSLHFIYYASLILTMLVFIFRHSTVKTFFVSLLAAVLIAILTGLLMVLGNLDEKGGFTLTILYYVAFAALGIAAGSSRTRSMVKGIGLNYFLFFLPFFPMLLTAFYLEILKSRSRSNEFYYEVQGRYFLYAEIIGLFLLLVAIEPVFRRLYRAWYAAPEE